ncbi:hypothetical protein F5144DRAFT_647314 [Chaetomium tenue]|uniref:Uncharacterized protein n=1 Tax=Chaetomium tenue TaxID=1854479 RepID=A0ACB7PFZ7_9PEZI|nr:hypothetical protein F5144DRAFT_647314 [Chaetomium globosum]
MFTSYRRSVNHTKLQFTDFSAPESAKHEEWNRTARRGNAPPGTTGICSWQWFFEPHYPCLWLSGFLFSRRSSHQNNTYSISLEARIPPLLLSQAIEYLPLSETLLPHMAPKREPNTPRTRGPESVRHQDRAYIPPLTENEHELTPRTGPYEHEPIPSDPPPSYRSQKSNPSADNLSAPTPPPFSTTNITLTSLADAAHPPSSPPPYPPPMRSPFRHQPTQARARTNPTTPLNSRYARKWPRAGDIACATVLVLAALAAALALLFGITVAVLSIARPPRHGRHENGDRFFTLRLPGPNLEPKLCSWQAHPPVQILEQHFSSRTTGKFTKLDLVPILSLLERGKTKQNEDFKLHTMASPTTRAAEVEAEERKILARYEAQGLYDMSLLKQASEGYDALQQSGDADRPALIWKEYMPGHVSRNLDLQLWQASLKFHSDGSRWFRDRYNIKL